MELEMKVAISIVSIFSVGLVCSAAAYSGCQKAPVVQTPIINQDTCNKFEYKVQYALPTVRPERRGDAGVESTSITPNQEDLSMLGKDGWDLTDSYLETETAYATLDKGLYPNQRPQRLVMILKRALPCK